MLKIKLYIAAILLLSSRLISQEIQNVDFTVSNNTVIITYDLVHSAPKKVYDISIKFIDEDGNETRPATLKGDIKKVVPGKNKKIEWNTLNDVATLKGNVKAVVEVSNSYSTKISGGPSCAFASMIVPGLGNYFVDKQDGCMPSYYIFGAFAGASAYALANKIDSDKYYSEYDKLLLQSQTTSSAVTNYQLTTKKQEAEKAYNSFVGLTCLASAIWIADVVYVAIKGRQNKRKALGFAFNQPKTKLYINCSRNNYGLGLIRNF